MNVVYSDNEYIVVTVPGEEITQVVIGDTIYIVDYV